MLLGYFGLELVKIANPNIIRHLNSYNPVAAKAALEQELGLITAALDSEAIDDETKDALRRRMDDVNRADFLVSGFKDALNEYGPDTSAKKLLEKGLEGKMHQSIGGLKKQLQMKVMNGEITQQQALIILKRKVSDVVPKGVNKAYLENFESHMGSQGRVDDIAAEKRQDHDRINKILGKFPGGEESKSPHEEKEESSTLPVEAEPPPKTEEPIPQEKR
jgi:hypothetical protein